MKQYIKVLGVSLVLIMILLGITSRGVEATTFNFMSANVPFTGGPPYGSVDVTADSGAGTVTFIITALTGASDTLAEFGFNTDLTLSTANFTTKPTGWTVGSGTMDGYGFFDWTVGSAAQGDRVDQATIVISGLTSSEAAEPHFEINNAGGHMFAAHLCQVGLTGFIDNATPTTGTSVPEPSLAFLLGFGLLGLVGLRRKWSNPLANID
jgi:hypothetical protein